MQPKMLDLIDVPVVETVVNIADAADTKKRENLVSNFVLTREVEHNLRILSQSFKGSFGQGYFLIGTYGSGKSHFLSYLSLIVSGEISSSSSSPLQDTIGEKKLLPIRISLINYRGSVSLEEIILSEVESMLSTRNILKPFTKRARFVEYMDRSIFPLDPSAFDNYLKQRGFPVWEKLRMDKKQAAEAAWGYFKTIRGKLEEKKGNSVAFPEMPDTRPDELIGEMVRSAGEIGYTGIIIVIDELSEFLRSKQSRSALSEDARYLQLLGELARTYPLWIVASLQEAIEQTGDISRDVISKIKDRYPIRLALGEPHMRELIAGRLIKKKDGAREIIRKIWQSCKENFPGFNEDFESFFQIYPLHPDTVHYLEGLTQIFSSHRGVVDFVSSHIHRKEDGANSAFLDASADKLITVDAIYQHFRDRIREDHRFLPYDDIVRRDLLRSCDKIFSDKSDHILAQRVCNLLVLTEIAKIERKKNVREIISILLAKIAGISPEADEEYMSDIILSPILKESLFVRCTEATKPGGRVYSLSLERDSRGLFSKELDQILASLDQSDSRLVSTALENIETDLPIHELIKGAVKEIQIPWRGTQRRGLCLWVESITPAEISLKIEDGNFDFALVYAPPNFLISKEELLPSRALLWSPRWDNEDVESFRKFYGVFQLLNERGFTETPVIEEARRIYNELKISLGKIIEKGFREGEIRAAELKINSLQSFHAATGFVERFITLPVIELLKKIYPRFLEIAPEVDFFSRRTLSAMIDTIITTGRISMATARKNNTRTMIEGVLIPLGIARVSSSSFVMQLDPLHSNLSKEVLDQVNSGIGDLQKLIKNLRFGTWGLSEDLAHLLLVSMVRSGLVDIYKNGRRIPTIIVDFRQVAEADEIRSGQLIGPELRERLFRDPLLSENLDKQLFSLSSQGQVWEKLLNFKQRLTQNIEEIMPKLAQISEYPVFDNFDFERFRSIITKGQEAIKNVMESQGAAKGLEKYLSLERPNLLAIGHELEIVGNFIKNDAERIVRIADYLQGIPSSIPLTEDMVSLFKDLNNFLKNLTDLILMGQSDMLFTTFDNFYKLYTEWYLGEHRRTFARERFLPYEAIREKAPYKALKMTDIISGINIVDNLRSIDKRIDSALSLRCQRTVSSELRLRSCCKCGYIPGDSMDIEDPIALENSIQSGLEEVIKELSTPQAIERMVARISALRDLNVDEFQRLEEFIGLLHKGLSVKDFILILTPELAMLINEALHRKVKIIKRNPSDLSKRISSRRLSPKRLLSIFEEWLGDIKDDDLLVDLFEDGDKQKDIKEVGLLSWISDHNLDEAGCRVLFSIPQHIEKRVGYNEVFEVEKDILEKMVDAISLSTASAEQCIDILKKEKRSIPFAWEVVNKLTIHLINGWVPSSKIKISSFFSDIESWIDSLLSAVSEFNANNMNDILSKETLRDRSQSYLEEHYFRYNFPNPHIMEHITTLFKKEKGRRALVFETLPEWKDTLDHMLNQYPEAAFLFIDAARWDLVPALKIILMETTGRQCTNEFWSRLVTPSTAAWQKVVFGTNELEAISSIMRSRKIFYLGDADRAKNRAKLKESNPGCPVWIRLGYIDRLIHSTSLPLYRILQEASEEFKNWVLDLEPFLRERKQIILLTDHGFSEVSNQRGNENRYGHEKNNIEDSLAAMLVF